MSTRFAPSPANASAVAQPIPALAPVINAVFPDNFPLIISSIYQGYGNAFLIVVIFSR
jgi:hypothetical protein